MSVRSCVPWLLAVSVVLVVSGCEPADAPAGSPEQRAVQASKEFVSALQRGQGRAWLDRHAPAGPWLRAAFADAADALSEAEGAETAALLRAFVARAESGSASEYVADGAQVAKNGDLIEVAFELRTQAREGKAGAAPEKRTFRFRERDGQLEMVDLEVNGKSVLAELGSWYAQGAFRPYRPGFPWDPLAFVWTITEDAWELDAPVFRALLGAPQPAWATRERLSLAPDLPTMDSTPADVAVGGQSPGMVFTLRRASKYGDEIEVFVTVPGMRGKQPLFTLEENRQPWEIERELQRLLDHIEKVAGAAGKAEDAASRMRVAICADAVTPSKYVIWLLRLGARAGLGQFSFVVRRSEADAAARVAKAGSESPFGRLDLVLDRYVDPGLDLEGEEEPVAEGAPAITVHLFRGSMDSPMDAYTRIRVGDTQKFALPRGGADGSAVFEQVEAAIRAQWEALGRSKEVQGVVSALPPRGGAVPYGDLARSLQALKRVGLTRLALAGGEVPLAVSR